MVKYKFYNEDCIKGSKKHIDSNSIDLIITDPPYGINGDTLHKHYNRDETNVIEGYVEIPVEEYGKFTCNWIKQAERILRPGGSIYVVSGYTNLFYILDALKKTSLKEVNHIIWKYNFGVYTTKKYVSSHCHILYCVKPGCEPTFNNYCRYGHNEKRPDGRSKNYGDREDVWFIKREFKPKKNKNKNELPTELLEKMIQYSSNENDLVCDLFLGGFSTARVAVGLNRNVVGFEISKNIYKHGIKKMKSVKTGELNVAKKPKNSMPPNRGKTWSPKEIERLNRRYFEIYTESITKSETIKILCKEFGRGKFSIMNALEKSKKEFDFNNKSKITLDKYLK